MPGSSRSSPLDCLVYTISGNYGSLEPGESLSTSSGNYTNEPSQALDGIMREGRHRYTVPAGRVRKDVWGARVQHARDISFPAPFLEIITKIQQSFIQVITDFCSSRASFEEGTWGAYYLWAMHCLYSGHIQRLTGHRRHSTP